MANVSIVSSNLVSIVIESLFYGVFLVLFFASTYFLVTRQLRGHHQNRPACFSLITPILFVNIMMFLVATAHWICGFIQLFQAFVYFNKGLTPLEYYADLSQPTEVTGIILIAVSLALQDAVLIYRLYLVFGGKQWIIIIPLFTLTGLFVCGIGAIYEATQYRIDGSPTVLVRLSRWIICGGILSVCTTSYCTGLITWRLWRNHTKLNGILTRRGLGHAITILIESALLFWSWGMVGLLLEVAQCNLVSAFLDSIPTVSGISFMLINVRVGLRNRRKAVISVSSTLPQLGTVSLAHRPPEVEHVD